MADAGSIQDNLSLRGMEGFGRFYGPYRGVVERNDDPEGRGRIQAPVPHPMGVTRLNVWIDPMFAGSGPDRGEFFPPEVGDTVWVCFLNGDPSRPAVYFGGWYSQPSGAAALPSEFAYQKSGDTVIGPNRRGVITRGGHRLFFDDTSGAESVELVWHQPDPSDPALTDRKKSADRSKGKSSRIRFLADGGVEVVNANGSKVELLATAKAVKVTDENQNQVTMDQNGVTVDSKKALTLKAATTISLEAPSILLGKSADAPLVRGTDLLTYLQSLVTFLNAHTHLSAAPGSPTTPPSPVPPPPRPPTPVLLSQVSKTK